MRRRERMHQHWCHKGNRSGNRWACFQRKGQSPSNTSRVLTLSTTPAPLPHSLSDNSQIALTVRDAAKATSLFRDALGLKFLFPAGPNLSFFTEGAVRIMLTIPHGHGEFGKNSIFSRRWGGARGSRRAQSGEQARATAHGENAGPRTVDGIRG